MQQVISTENIPIKLWLNNIEEGALKQAKNIANLPFAFRHVAIMPDSHEGYGMPIGGVLATKGVIVPNAVGVDIGCGMCAVKTNLHSIQEKELKKIMGAIRNSIPLGFKHHPEKKDVMLMPSMEKVPQYGIVQRQFDAARGQIGTLGGGNHFIEIQKGNDGHIWIMIHSGSRNIGLKVAEHYNRLAKKLNEQWHSEVDKKMDLAFLPIETQEAKDYFNEMQYCVDFAFANRKLMMDTIKGIFLDFVGKRFEEFDFVNIAHNYAAWENHFGSNVIVHRKGATSAREGEIGIIPGSQGTKSYIVRGKGNPESFTSCSHGAGRLMGRKQAQRELNLEAEIARLDKQGIIHSIRHKSDLDEAPSAYKNIDVVMENQSDLVDIVVELSPLAVVKG
ncbi:MAG: RtcB family protein [Bacteroidales bacterium]|nr:RtcB family protein [Bacteroidales bacterium]MCF8455025.1 RtcB family protein [Bacteroidales bacterium]